MAMSPMSLMTEEEKRKAFGSASKGGKRDWGEEGAPSRRPRASRASARPGAAEDGRRRPGHAGKARRSRQGQGQGSRRWPRARAAAATAAVFAKLKSLSQEERAQLVHRAPTKKRRRSLKKAGLTDAEIEQMAEMRRRTSAAAAAVGGGGGGGGRRGGGGRSGGGGDGSGGSDQ